VMECFLAKYPVNSSNCPAGMVVLAGALWLIGANLTLLVRTKNPL
jgi:hypothetical protein